MTTKKLKLLLTPLLVLSALASCSWENEADGQQVGKNNEVVFSMRIPANSALTRSLTEADEYEVKTLDVLVFEYKSDGSGKLLSRATHSGTPKINDRDLDFYVRLETKDDVTNYDFILLANGREAINYYLYEDDLLKVGMSKAEVQETLKSGIPTGYGWIIDKTSPAYKPMPMWGELTNQTIEAGKTYNRTTLLRATVKIDIEVELMNAADKFELEEVRYYNYNTQGYIIPLPKNLENGKAKEPTIDGLTFNMANPIDYSSGISSDKKSLKNSIYCFEGPKGSIDNDKYMDNPCLLVKGNFNGAIGWYRLDFANVNPNDQTSTYLSLLRNHSYNMKITAVNGPGFPEPGEALNSKPVNVVTNVSQWDGEDLSGIWNGNYEIKFTSLEANFTQFGEPSPQVATITTNCPSLTFENFTNIVKGTGDTDWTKSSADTWTNSHFTVKITKGTTIGETKTYIIEITAKNTGDSDPKRLSSFSIKGSNMEATFRITQDQPLTYRLITDPDPINPIMIDGPAQRIRVNVTSTHDYRVNLNTSIVTMFSKIYDSPTGGNELNSANISKNYKNIYVETIGYSQFDPRVGTFSIEHIDDKSEAQPASFTVVQVSPLISAIIDKGAYSKTISKAGKKVKINVSSNLNEWIPVLKRKIGNGSQITITDTNELRTYFGITSGAGSSQVTFTAPEIYGESDYVYTITFRNANGDKEETAPAIVITQKTEAGMGDGGIPPTSGVRGEPNILCVDEDGVLNLDGRGYIVYFKWGSTIGLSRGSTFNQNNVAWTPIGFDYDALIDNIGSSSGRTALNRIPYQSSGDIIIDDTKAGTGDPCKLAGKNKTSGNYRMPTKAYYDGYNKSMRDWSTENGANGRYNTNGTQFYPAAGHWSTDGTFYYFGYSGFYWSDSPGDNLNFTATNIFAYSPSGRSVANPIRCVPID